MHQRSFVLALTAAALLGLTGPATAQPAVPIPSTAPEPSSSPEPNPSAEPNASRPANAEPSAAPGDDASPPSEPSAKRSLSGTLMSLKGTVATVRMANGTIQSYAVSAKLAAALKKRLGKKLLFRVVHGAFDLIPR